MAFVHEYGGPETEYRDDPNSGWVWVDDLHPVDPEIDPELLEFAHEIEIPIVIDEVIAQINEEHLGLGHDRFVTHELARPYRHPDTGLPIFEYGPADGKTAVVVPFQFIGGTDESLNMRLYLLKRVLDAMNITDEDGQEIRVVGIASPSVAVRMGIHLKDYVEMFKTAEHDKYTQHISKTLGLLGVERVITAGASLGGMVSAQLVEQMLRTGELDPIGSAIANPPGQGRSRGSIPRAMLGSLIRYNRSGGDTRSLVHASGLEPLIKMLPNLKEYKGRQLPRLSRALDIGDMACRSMGHPGNLGLGRVLSERTTPPAMKLGLSRGLPIDYFFSLGDKVPFMRRGLKEVNNLKRQFPGLLDLVYTPDQAHEVVSDPRLMTAFYVRLIQRALRETADNHDTDVD